MSRICYIMGKSSSGKDTLYKKLQEEFPQLKAITLYTTRPIRAGETDGQEYHFVDEMQLIHLQGSGKVIELRAYHTQHGIWKYFTADDGQVDLVHSDYLMIGTLESYKKMRKYYGSDVMLPVYIEVEDGARLARALERERQQEEPKYAEMCRRFLADSEDFSEERITDAGIYKRFENDDFSKCLSEIVLYLKEKLWYNVK